MERDRRRPGKFRRGRSLERYRGRECEGSRRYARQHAEEYGVSRHSGFARERIFTSQHYDSARPYCMCEPVPPFSQSLVQILRELRVTSRPKPLKVFVLHGLSFPLCGFEMSHFCDRRQQRSEEHTSELQSLMRLSYAGFCLKKKKKKYV